MKLYIIAIALLLTACGDDPKEVAYVTREGYNQAAKLCEPFGGVTLVKRYATCEGRGCSWVYYTQGQCANSAIFRAPEAAQ